MTEITDAMVVEAALVISDMRDRSFNSTEIARLALAEAARVAGTNLQTNLAGWKLVPLEPDAVMIADAAEEMADEPIYDKQIVEIYRAMIDASPTFSASPAAPTPAEGEGVFVSRKLIGEAHAVMRACGWHLAPGSELQSDGVIEAAAAEIEEQFCGLLSTPAEGE